MAYDQIRMDVGRSRLPTYDDTDLDFLSRLGIERPRLVGHPYSLLYGLVGDRAALAVRPRWWVCRGHAGVVDRSAEFSCVLLLPTSDSGVIVRPYQTRKSAIFAWNAINSAAPEATPISMMAMPGTVPAAQVSAGMDVLLHEENAWRWSRPSPLGGPSWP